MTEDQANEIIRLLKSIDDKLEIVVDGAVEVRVVNKVEVEGSVVAYDPH